MLDVEINNDWAGIASLATNELVRQTLKSPVSPALDGATNPIRRGLLRDMRKLLKKNNGDCVLFVTLTSKSAQVDTAKPSFGGLYQYELTFKGKRLQRFEYAAAAYNG